MYRFARRFASRPTPHCHETITDLWTRPHIAERMLSFHLDPETCFASRPEVEIEKIVNALDKELDLSGKRVCDLGCGPGLYSRKFAELGARVTGVDISGSSIDYARRQPPVGTGSTEYVIADYLGDPLGDEFDVVTLIYFDFCALSPANRSGLLNKIRRMLKPGGILALDVVSESVFDAIEETLTIEENLMAGFWSAADYVGIHRRWRYDDLKLTLDHYGICEEEQSFEVFNWMQYFSPERLVRELEGAGFSVVSLDASLDGRPLTAESAEIAVIARTEAVSVVEEPDRA